jgi:hypothetical protein
MHVLRDLRHSVRSFARTPVVTAILLITIALGVGSNAAVTAFTRGSIARDLRIPGIRSTVSLFSRDGDRFGPVSYDTYAASRAANVFESVGAARQARTAILEDGREAVVSAVAVTPDIANLLQLPLAKGVAISHRWWKGELNAKDIDRLRLNIDGTERPVAAVAPEWLEGLYSGIAADIWMPLDESALASIDRGSRNLWAFGRLKPGTSADDAEGLLNASRNGADLVAVLPYTGMTPDVAAGLRRIRALLSTAAGLVFFIACVNVATFLLSRASTRSHETSVRVALGASRGTLLRQLLADSVLLSLAGAALGLLAAWWTTRLVAASLFDADAERLVFAPNLAGIAAVSFACAAITAICGLLPILQVRDDRPAAVLRRESAGPSGHIRRLRSGLVAAQMTCCCVLVMFTAYLLSGFRTALETRAGRRLHDGILATVQASSNFERPHLGLDYFRAVEETARSLPGSSAFAWSGAPPGSRPGWQPVTIEPSQLPLRDVMLHAAALTPQALGSIDLTPVAGRLFGARDSADSCKVAVINEQAAALFDGSAVGRSLVDPDGRRLEVIGIVAARDRERNTPPTVFYYPQQLAPPVNTDGAFRIPMPHAPMRGVLEANVVSRGYFDTIGLSIADGGLFGDSPRGCREAVINQEAADLYFGGKAVGGAVLDGAGRRSTIVGVVRSSLLRASQHRPEAAIYFPMTQDFLPRMTVTFSARDTGEATLKLLRRRLDAVAGGLPEKTVVTTLEAHLTKTALAPERIAVVLVSASAATALTLGVLGLYGAILDTTRLRRREFAMRAALGASAPRVIRLVVAEGVRLALAGTIAGMLASLLVARWLVRIAPVGGPVTTAVWLSAPLVLLGAVAVASALPARHALRVNLLTIMREE